MRPSSIELERYFVTDLNVSANLTFDENKPTGLTIDDLATEPECFSEKADPRHWMIRLRVKNTENKERNTPYFFSIEVAGFFKVNENVPSERVGDFARINGASILYGTAREVLRNAMSLGPHAPILLPAVCFLDATPETAQPKTPPRKRTLPEATKKTPRKRTLPGKEVS